MVGRRARPPHEEDYVNLSAPTQIVFIISAILAIVGLFGALEYVAAVADYATWMLFLGWALLAAGTLLKDL